MLAEFIAVAFAGLLVVGAFLVAEDIYRRLK